MTEHIYTPLDKAEQLCQNRNIRLTAQRREVLRLLLSQNKAISAYDLLDQLRLSEPQAKPPTIYRALDFLLEQGFIHKVESSNSYIVCPHFDEPSHISVLFICGECKKIIEKHSTEVEQALTQLAQQQYFTISRSIVEVHGTCQTCQKKPANQPAL